MSLLDLDMTNLTGLAIGAEDGYSSLSITGALFAPGVQFTQVEFDFFEHSSPMIIRLMPLMHNGAELPAVTIIDGEPKITPWLAKLPVVTCGTTSKTMFALFNPWAERDRQVDASRNPYIVLRRKARIAASDNSNLADPYSGMLCKNIWPSILEGKNSSLPNWSDNYFAQGIAYTNGTELTIERREDGSVRPLGIQTANKKLIMFRFAKSAGLALNNAVIAYYKAGVNAISLDTSYFIGVYNDGKCSPIDVDAKLYEKHKETQANAMGSGANVDIAALMAASQAASGGGDSKEVFHKYGVHVCRYARLQQAKPLLDIPVDAEGWKLDPATIDEIRKRYQPLNQCFQILSYNEQAVMIAKAFADQPFLLQHGWTDTEYLKLPEVAEIVYAKTNAVAPLVGDQSRGGALGSAVSAAANAIFGGQSPGFGQPPQNVQSASLPGQLQTPSQIASQFVQPAGGTQTLLPNGASGGVVTSNGMSAPLGSVLELDLDDIPGEG